MDRADSKFRLESQFNRVGVSAALLGRAAGPRQPGGRCLTRSELGGSGPAGRTGISARPGRLVRAGPAFRPARPAGTGWPGSLVEEERETDLVRVALRELAQAHLPRDKVSGRHRQAQALRQRHRRRRRQKHRQRQRQRQRPRNRNIADRGRGTCAGTEVAEAETEAHARAQKRQRQRQTQGEAEAQAEAQSEGQGEGQAPQQARRPRASRRALA